MLLASLGSIGGNVLNKEDLEKPFEPISGVWKREDEVDVEDKCSRILADENIDKAKFARTIGHATHTLYLEPLR